MTEELKKYSSPIIAALAVSIYFVGGENFITNSNPLFVSSVVTLASGALLLLYSTSRLSWAAVLATVKRDILPLILCGGFLGVAYILSFSALNVTTATSVTIFTALEPVIYIVFNYFGWIVEKMLLSFRTLLFMFAVVLSALYSRLSMAEDSFKLEIGKGELFATLSAVSFALGILFSQRVIKKRKGQEVAVIGIALLIGGTLVLSYVAITGVADLDFSFNTCLSLGGVSFFIALSWAYFYIGIASIGSAMTGVLYQSKILFVFSLSVIVSSLELFDLKHVSTSMTTISGIFFVIASSVFLVISREKDIAKYSKRN